MEEASKLHRDVPYGWVLAAAALWRLVARRRRAEACSGEGLAGGLNQLSHPH